MATLISGQINYDDDGQPNGIVFTYRVEFQQRSGFLTQAQVDGLSLSEIKALAQSVADADTGLVGNPYLFNMSNEATIDFDNLPGWASWTGQEASDYIEANVTDLSSAKLVLKNMARAIMYLRDISL